MSASQTIALPAMQYCGENIDGWNFVLALLTGLAKSEEWTSKQFSL